MNALLLRICHRTFRYPLVFDRVAGFVKPTARCASGNAVVSIGLYLPLNHPIILYLTL
jgi:hypothetical protein